MNALEKTKIPAIILMIVSGIGIAFNLVMVVMNILVMAGVMPQSQPAIADPQAQAIANATSGVIGIIFMLVCVVLNVVILLGAIKMKKGESYGLAMAAAIIAIIPCYTTCCLSIPFGIWALVVLLNDEVKQAFNQGASA